MKKGFLNNFANWILDKLATKVYNQLATSNKTMIGALNELNSKWTKEYDWRSYDDIMTAINSEKEITLAQGVNIFPVATSGGHPYMVITCVPESKDAVGVYVDYFKPTVTAFRYKNDSFELII